MCGHIWHYPSNFCQYINSLYCYMHNILFICTLRFFFIFMTATSTERPLLCWYAGHSYVHDKTAVQYSKKCFPKLLWRPPETLEATCWCTRKPFWRKALAPECKYTILIFILPVLELSGHRLYTLAIYIIDLEKSCTIFYNETPLGTVKIQCCFEKPTAFIFKVFYIRIQAVSLSETLLNFYQTTWHHVSVRKCQISQEVTWGIHSSWIFRPLKMKELWSFEMSEISHPLLQVHIPAEQIPLPHQCENLKTHKMYHTQSHVRYLV